MTFDPAAVNFIDVSPEGERLAFATDRSGAEPTPDVLVVLVREIDDNLESAELSRTLCDTSQR